jgi:hypothetical protein
MYTTLNTDDEDYINDPELLCEETTHPSRTQGFQQVQDFIYTYYVAGGHKQWFFGECVRIGTLLWTVFVSILVVAVIDWVQLVATATHKDCDASQMLSTVSSMSVVSRIMYTTYLVVCSVYLLWAIASLWSKWNDMKRVHAFWKTNAHTQLKKVTQCEWTGVVLALSHQQTQSGRPMSPLDITMQLLRKDNYVLALLHSEILPHLHINAAVLWALHAVLLEPMFVEEHGVKRLALSPRDLRRRCRQLCLLYLLFSPCLMMFILVHTLLKAAELSARRKVGFRMRTWSTHSKWHFRNYNEFEHQTTKRLVVSAPYAQQLIDSEPSPWLHAISGAAMTVSGSAVGCLLVLGVCIEDVLVHLHIWGRNLFWWIAVMGGCYALSSSVFFHGRSSDQFDGEHVRKLRAKLQKNSHLGCHKPLKTEVATHFSFFFINWYRSLRTMLVFPCTLMEWANKAEQIVSFLKTNTTSTPVGDVCTFSLFEETDTVTVSTLEAQSRQSFHEYFSKTIDES